MEISDSTDGVRHLQKNELDLLQKLTQNESNVNTRTKTIKVLEENTNENSMTLNLAVTTGAMTLQVQATKEKVNKRLHQN